MIPSSVTVADSNWTVTKTSAGPPATYTIALSCVVSGTCLSNVTDAVPPGGNFPITVNYSGSQTSGAYNVTWSVEGANGGVASSTSTTGLTVSATAANVEFYAAGGSSTNPTVWNNGLEPQIGSDYATYGNGYTYRITNAGSTSITAVSIAIPHLNRTGTVPAANTWPNGTNPWYVTGTPAYASSSTATTSSCSSITVVQPTSSADGAIYFTCPAGAFAGGKVIDLSLTMQAPYEIGDEFVFPAVINGSGTYYASSGTAASPSYSTATWLQIVLNASLQMFIPNASLQIARPGNPNPATASCPGGCVFTAAVGNTPASINISAFTGVFTGTDLVNASVTTGAIGPHGWNLYVSVDNNPNNASTGFPLLAGRVNTTDSASVAGYTTSMTSFTTLPVVAPASLSASNPGTQISQYYGTVRRGNTEAIDTLMDFQISGTGDLSTPRSVTVTYTLVPN